MKRFLKNRTVWMVAVIVAVFVLAVCFGGTNNSYAPALQAVPDRPSETPPAKTAAPSLPEAATAPAEEAVPDAPAAGVPEDNAETKSDEKTTEESAGTALDAPSKQPQENAVPDVQPPALPESDPASKNQQAQEISNAPAVENTITLSIRCDVLLNKLDALAPGKAELVPEDGVLLGEIKAEFFEGDSVFNVLQRELKKQKIHLEFSTTPLYNSSYIEGIGNLYEFDCGPLSGWMYKVNGTFPSYGSSRYTLSPGDVVEWVYTCDLGRDIGSSLGAMQR